MIGKGGETIKSINSFTGAHCEVDKSAPRDAREKNFIIHGSRDAVERAKAMIMEKISMPVTASTSGFQQSRFQGDAAALKEWPYRSHYSKRRTQAVNKSQENKENAQIVHNYTGNVTINWTY